MNKSARIAICGAGLVGAYLYRILHNVGCSQIDIFERSEPHTTHCGINPCAWGALTGFEEKIDCTGLKSSNYVLRAYDHLVINEVSVNAKVMLIDKPRLIVDLMGGKKVHRSPPKPGDYERIIDATGHSRAYLPPAEDDLFADCVQQRVTLTECCEAAIYVGNLGYAWRFPISDTEYHIGAGSVAVVPGKLLEKLGWLDKHHHICTCSSKIRLSGVQGALPFVRLGSAHRPAIWGVGEAIGCVSPLMGEGILPGLNNADILVQNWDNPEGYRKAVLKEFSWMKDERQVLDKLVNNRPLGIFDATTLSRSVGRLKMEFNYAQSASLLNSVNRKLSL